PFLFLLDYTSKKLTDIQEWDWRRRNRPSSVAVQQGGASAEGLLDRVARLGFRCTANSLSEAPQTVAEHACIFDPLVVRGDRGAILGQPLLSLLPPHDFGQGRVHR